jgi:hypothetical protein
MAIVLAKYVAIDSATLGQIAKDYWSASSVDREKARTFVRATTEAGIYLTLTTSHICELLGHKDVGRVRERVQWLRELPFVAWIRPYSRVGSFGGMFDLLMHELHAVVHDGAKDWATIIEQVRAKLLCTGIGRDVFADTPRLWETLSVATQRHLALGQYAASLLRIDPGDLFDSKYGDLTPLSELPELSAEIEAEQFADYFEELKSRFSERGDSRISATAAATRLGRKVLDDLEKVRAIGGNPYVAILQVYGIPRELVTEKTTMRRLRELSIYVGLLKMLVDELNPAAKVTVLDVSPESLPSSVIERELQHCQRSAERVSGSDMGDSHIAPFSLYLDAVEVDKRTDDHLRKIRRGNPRVAQHLGHVFRCSDYANLPTRLVELGVTNRAASGLT